MRVGLISDIHSNIVALYAVARDMPQVDEVICAGDVVGYNPWPGDAIEFLRERGISTVSGNHDEATVSGEYGWFNKQGREGIEYTRNQLSDDQIRWLSELPKTLSLFEDRVKVIHDHPEKPGNYTYPDEFESTLLGSEDVLVLGHTHIQHAETYQDGTIVNPGSVGQPRDGDPRAGYAVLDLDSGTVDLHRVRYSISKVQHEIISNNLPKDTANRLAEGR